ncbi:hypothetical protein [Empedobacter falsenii]|uniref:Uncharacterized protein n=1 Tax=Empedobacter falsenii TaxID=343874 RepID=A0A7H9DPZ0_9FLAO|nr:hypothetical protein [Empedobacter falsenii]QLL57227.1 hypothetical protein FH779_03590 [Empedobacter falsenii]
MENQLTLQEKKTIISQFLNISFFGDINPPKFKRINDIEVKEFSDFFKSGILNRTEDYKPFILSSISAYISNLNETERKKLYLMMISTGNFTADAFLFNENDASIEEIHIGILEAIKKNQNNLFVNLFFARILTIKGGIIAHKKHFATKEWYDSAIENQLKDYNELCFIN